MGYTVGVKKAGQQFYNDSGEWYSDFKKADEDARSLFALHGRYFPEPDRYGVYEDKLIGLSVMVFNDSNEII